MAQDKIPLIGIAGGVASGKSLIAEQLRRAGAAVISADELAHEVLKFDEVKRAARERWGEAIFGPAGEVDRRALAKIVFGANPAAQQELEFLEQRIHPHVGRLAREQIARLSEAPGNRVPAIVMDVPLLFESGWNKFCDKILFVDAAADVRLGRALGRGWTKEEFARREACQESLEHKRRLADVVIDNSGSKESAQAQVDQFWQSLTGSPLAG
jgi:dephospho-CoA kinase